MTDLLTRPTRAEGRTQGSVEERLNRRGSLEPREPGRPRRSLVVGPRARLRDADDPGPRRRRAARRWTRLRRLVGEVYGPVQAGCGRDAAPVRARAGLGPEPPRHGSATSTRLEAENDRLRGELATTDYDRNRLAGVRRPHPRRGADRLRARPGPRGGIGAAQSFSQTVTIDAGTRAGVRADLTVVNADGLVGRVIRVTSTTATVLLVVDADSTVGGRVGLQHEGRASCTGAATWTVSATRPGSTSSWSTRPPCPHAATTVVTWGSDRGAPYVSGVPVGRVDSVYSSLRETTQRAEIDPFVDFGALDLVGVVVPSGTAERPGRVEADGSLRVSDVAWPRDRSPRRWRSRSRWCCRSRCSRTWPGRASCPTSSCSSSSARHWPAAPSSRWCWASRPGLLLDLAPPADHVVGRWALALIVVGYVAGRMRTSGPTVGHRDGRHRAGLLVRRHVGVRAHRDAAARPRGRRAGPAPGDCRRSRLGRAARARSCCRWCWRCFAGPSPTAPGMKPDASTDRRAPQPAAAGGDPGAGLLAVRDPARAALPPAGGHRRGVHRPGRVPVGPRGRRAAAARADRRRHGPAAGRQPHVVGRLDRPRRRSPRCPRTSSARCCAGSRGSPTSRSAGSSGMLVTCGDDRQHGPGVCWNGSPLQPVPIAVDVPQPLALRVLEQPEDFPAVLADQQSLRDYPRPFGINLAHVLGYLSPITGDELDQAEAGRRPLGQRRVRRRPRRRREAVRRVAARDARLHPGRGGLDGPGDRRRRRGRGAARRHARHLDRREGPGRRRAPARRDDPDRAPDLRRGHPPQLPRGLGRGGRDGGGHRPDRRDGQPADVRPLGLGRRHHQEAARAPLLGGGRHAAARRGRPRASSRPARRGSRSWRSARWTTASRRTTDELHCSSGLQVGNRWFKNYESASYGYIGFDEALQLSCDTFFYRVGLQLLAAVRLRPDRRATRRTRSSQEAKNFGFGSRTGVDLPGEASGRIADRRWKLAYWKSMRSYYCRMDRDGTAEDTVPAGVRPRVLPRGQLLPRRRRRELLDRPGRHDRHAAAARPGVRRARQRRHALRAARGQGGGEPGRHRAQAVRAEGRTGTCGRRRPTHAVRRHRAARHAEGRHPGLEVRRLPARPRSTSAARPARPRSTASSRRRGWRRTTRTTWS